MRASSRRRNREDGKQAEAPERAGVPHTKAPPLYVPSPKGALSCRFCKTLKLLHSFVWRENVEQYRKLFAEGECSATMVGCTYELIEAGEDYSLFRICRKEVGPELFKLLPAAWIRNCDMHLVEEPGE
jgi:hypothetical protein